MPGVQKDTGWAWLVLLGATLEMMLCVGLVKTSGILFVAFQERFNSTSAMTSLLSTVQNTVYSISALMVMTIGVRVTTCRNLVYIGSLLMSGSLIITSLAGDIKILLLSYGVMQGMGMAFMMPVALTMVSLYFDKRIGFANCIPVSGGSLGGLIFAPLVTHMFSKYGFQGCLLIISGILLHTFISASLYRPISYFETDTTPAPVSEYSSSSDDSDSIENESLLDNGKEPTVNNTPANSVNRLQTPDVYGSNSKLRTTPAGVQQFLRKQNKRIRCYSENRADELKVRLEMPTTLLAIADREKSSSQVVGPKKTPSTSIRDIVQAVSISASQSMKGSRFMTGSMFDVTMSAFPIKTFKTVEIQSVQSMDLDDMNDMVEDKFNCLDVLKKIFDRDLLTMPMFILFEVSGLLLSGATLLVTIFIAPYAKDVGISASDAALLVTIFGSVDLCARLALAFISDKGWLRRSTIVGIVSVVIGIASHLARFYVSFSSLVVFSVVLGLTTGAYFALYVTIIVDYLGIERLQSVLGFTSLCHGFATAGTYYLVGYLRDATGSYVVPYHMLGTMSIAGAILVFLMPVLQARQNKPTAVIVDVVELQDDDVSGV